jgi:hypothetical protein
MKNKARRKRENRGWNLEEKKKIKKKRNIEVNRARTPKDLIGIARKIA